MTFVSPVDLGTGHLWGLLFGAIAIGALIPPILPAVYKPFGPKLDSLLSSPMFVTPVVLISLISCAVLTMSSINQPQRDRNDRAEAAYSIELSNDIRKKLHPMRGPVRGSFEHKGETYITELKLKEVAPDEYSLYAANEAGKLVPLETYFESEQSGSR